MRKKTSSPFSLNFFPIVILISLFLWEVSVEKMKINSYFRKYFPIEILFLLFLWEKIIYNPRQMLYSNHMGEKPNFRNRSVAIVIRDGKILMERLCYKDANKGKEFFSVPGGGIEEGETPEQAVLRELKEECGLDDTIVKALAIVCSQGRKEYSFEVSVPDDQQAITGYDPEEAGSDNPPLREVVWKSLDEINEKDRAFLFSYGLIQVQGFYETIVGWGDEISYPGQV